MRNTTTTLPPQAAFYHAILRHLAEHPEGDRRENILQAMPRLLGLTETQRTERLGSHPYLRYRHRAGFALSILKRVGYTDSPQRSVWRITNHGRELLARYPEGFSQEVVREVLRDYRSETRNSEAVRDVGDGPTAEQT